MPFPWELNLLLATSLFVFTLRLSLVPSPKEEEEKDWFQLFARALNRGGIPPPLHIIDILLYTCDANIINTKCYTVRKFIIAAYGHARDSLDCTHPAADLKL